MFQGLRVRLPAREADVPCFDVGGARRAGRLRDEPDSSLLTRLVRPSRRTSRRHTHQVGTAHRIQDDDGVALDETRKEVARWNITAPVVESRDRPPWQ